MLRILVVDDSIDSADAMAAVLRAYGYSTRACYDGLEAIEIARQFQPQIFLIDLGMPGLSGLDLAAKLREAAGAKPLILIAVTGFGDLEMRTQTALGGFHYHFTKPVEFSEVTDVLENLDRLKIDWASSSEEFEDQLSNSELLEMAY